MGNETSSPAGVGSSSKSRPKGSGIVVVTRAEERKDSSSVELDYCPTFQPLLSTSLNIPETRPLLSELVKQINHKSCLKLCIHLQNHFKQCAEAVKFDQEALISRIKEVDRVSGVVLQHLTERQRTFAKHLEQTNKVKEISTTLTSLQRHMDKTINLANELNYLLPEDLKLEKLQL